MIDKKLFSKFLMIFLPIIIVFTLMSLVVQTRRPKFPVQVAAPTPTPIIEIAVPTTEGGDINTIENRMTDIERDLEEVDLSETELLPLDLDLNVGL